VTHAVVLAVAVAISGYASLDRHFQSSLTARLGAVNAEAVVSSEGGTIGDVSLGRYSTIIKPVAIPLAAPISHAPVTYAVGPGDSLKLIAARFRVTVAQIRWSNTNLVLNDSVALGDQLVIPPVPGIVVTTKATDTLQSLAVRWQSDPQTIVDFNRLRGPQLTAGTVLVIPGGIGGDFPPPLPAAPISIYVGITDFFHSTIGAPVGHYPVTRFPWGWCTWYVASRRPVPWGGNAIEWYGNARAMGFPVGSQPKVGAIMVTTESPIGLGHVAYVEQVYPDGSWQVSEMHWVAFGVTSQRVIHPGQLKGALIGFIYGGPTS
jgi:LysM repeat protein